jgi:shikimate dehydrogenase
MSLEVVLLGHRIAYSASPAMQNAAFRALDLDGSYGLRDEAPDGLAEAVAELRGPGLHGANVTIPHKVAVVALLDALDPAAERLGAVNTIVREGERLIGHNTDFPALAAELAELVGPSPGRAVVLGTGGAARAAEAALADAHGLSVILVGRDLSDELPRLLADADLLVNATPVGTASDESPVPAGLLHRDLSVMDLVYRPSPTRLVRDARAAGAQAQDGAGMLLRQAVASFELWTGRSAPFEVMRAALEAELQGAVRV